MKKIAFLLSFLMIFSVFTPAVMAKDKKKEKTELTEEDKARLVEIENRIEEIKATDFSDLTKEERRALKNELKEMKVEARERGGGVYLSIGAIIIIILLLILLL
ncbi:hypothetical protein [Pararhodonellum marinum]|uniref:hypothetical protein n=1 Tax=Pararhodonellum marinum TaxID=2755358 RepID=UPI001890A27B|nr:hypothetical protein [Pararhodonellum marinum]